MRSTRQALITSIAVSLSFLLAACSSSGSSVNSTEMPVVGVHGSRAFEYKTLDQLAKSASAIVVVTPTGEGFDQPLPIEQGGAPDLAPIQYVTVQVTKVINGSLDAETIDVVSPGDDERTGQSVLRFSDSFILFVTPARYGVNEPAGGYAIVGGTAGTYIKVDEAYRKMDQESPELPGSVSPDDTAWPDITKTEVELLREDFPSWSAPEL